MFLVSNIKRSSAVPQLPNSPIPQFGNDMLIILMFVNKTSFESIYVKKRAFTHLAIRYIFRNKVKVEVEVEQLIIVIEV